MSIDLRSRRSYRLAVTGLFVGSFVTAVVLGGVLAHRSSFLGASVMAVITLFTYEVFTRMRAVHRGQRPRIWAAAPQAKEAAQPRPPRQQQATTTAPTPATTQLSKKARRQKASVERARRPKG